MNNAKRIRPCLVRLAGMASVVSYALASATLVANPTVSDVKVDTAPNYAQSKNWAVRSTSTSPTGVDVFYIHPTTFHSQEWNQPIHDTQTREWTIKSVVDRQLSAFSACCRRFMPFYRQASTRAFAERDGQGAAAYDIAYQDIRNAFRVWQANNRGRPFILAGHSQGALLGLRLLQREITGTLLAERLVAAYLPGIGIPISALPAGIGPCLERQQTGCVVSWNAFTLTSDTTQWIARSQVDYGLVDHNNAILCINPVTFDATRPASFASEAKGMLPAAEKGVMPAPIRPRPASARCENGVLRVHTAPETIVRPLPNGSLHMHDIALFWADISANSAARAAAWRKDNP